MQSSLTLRKSKVNNYMDKFQTKIHFLIFYCKRNGNTTRIVNMTRDEYGSISCKQLKMLLINLLILNWNH